VELTPGQLAKGAEQKGLASILLSEENVPAPDRAGSIPCLRDGQG
jgi:hypothetical protein